MKRYGLNELRELFLSFFEEKQHLRLPSFSLVPQGDASLLLINSGMAPMKTWFTGTQTPPGKRVCTCQKCIRTTDIDSVGKTARHGSYFEMLGNFSFGDYFKKDAIVWCWEFLTVRLGISPELLYPSVYFEDDEAFNIWKDIVGIPPGRIVKLGREDNFWDHGSGPCGPCSEVYFDRGIERGCGSPDCAPGCDCDRYVEVWNNVFTQFDNDGKGNYSELAQKNIDTGLGLERLACVCQNVESIFEIDTIKSIVDKISELCSVPYGQGIDTDTSIRIITDHTRAAVMMICDGVLPSNEGRGYVLRRLIRRAAMRGNKLGLQGGFFDDICRVVINENKDAYPDLNERSGFIKRVLKAEEESFGKTVSTGISMLDSLIQKLKKDNKTILSGADAFKLYDTFGFPLDLTLDILAEHGMTADTVDFDIKMDNQRSRARQARENLGDLAWDKFDFGLGSTPTVFTGYDNRADTVKILAIVTGGEQSSSLSEGDEGLIILDKTPFYAEKGGQVADSGHIILSHADKNCFEVTDVQVSKSDRYLHYGKMKRGHLSVENTVTCVVDDARRDAIMRAHCATHLVHHALRSVLGTHVNQAGSLVEPDKLRFDFTHFSAMTEEEIAKVEEIVNNAVMANHAVETKEMPVAEAKKLGAAALFGEKYGDIVRVVKAGDSIELCGGTHPGCTAQVGLFSVVSEFSVASGVRRIQAVTGIETKKLLQASRNYLSEISSLLKANSPDEITGKIEQTLSMLRDTRSKLESIEAKDSNSTAKNILSGAKDICGYKVLLVKVNESEMNTDKARQTADALRDMEPSVSAVFIIISQDKLTALATCGKKAVAKGIKAGDLIRNVSQICGGGGGGKPEFAMGGGKDVTKTEEALAFVDKYIRDILE